MQSFNDEEGEKMTELKNRNLKVYSFGDSRTNECTKILLQGKWLEGAGFEIGDRIIIEPSDGKLLIVNIGVEGTD